MSPPPIAVTLVEYDPEWPQTAEWHRERLRLLGQNIVEIYHIGSTSVPGLAAKPIIDLMPIVIDLAELDRQRHLVEALGYGWYGELGIADRRYCTYCDDLGVRKAQLHFFAANSLEIKRHIAFRDYLRAYPQVASAYQNEKYRAQRLHPENSHAYGDEKHAWIENIEIQALAWSASR